MNAHVLDAGSPATCQPLTCGRPLAQCPVANRPLAEAQRAALREAGFAVTETAPGRGMALHVRGDAWLSPAALEQLARAHGPCVLREESGGALAWIGGPTGEETGMERLLADRDSFRIRYAWDLLRVNERLVGAMDRDAVEGEISPAAHIEGRLALGSGSRILPGVYVEGNVVIGAGCKVGPNCYLRGNTSIGDGCHIGQAVEIKNSILMRNVAIGHLSYCGDSIVGEGVNFGAGTITANFRHDGKPHRSMAGGVLVDTGRRKLGAIVGDGVHTGIHTSIYPGRKLWPGTATRPGAVIERDLTVPREGE